MSPFEQFLCVGPGSNWRLWLAAIYCRTLFTRSCGLTSLITACPERAQSVMPASGADGRRFWLTPRVCGTLAVDVDV
jgi:hypothetical protein